MKVTSFLACQYASLTDKGLVDLGGIGMDGVNTPQVPVTMNLFFFARCESDLLEPEGTHTTGLHLVGDDKILSKHNGPPFTTKGAIRNHNLIINFLMTLKQPGGYRVDLLIDGKVGASWPLSVNLLPQKP